MPNYSFSKNFEILNINGSFNFDSQGNNTLNETNKMTSVVSNGLNYTTFDYFNLNGIKSNFEVFVKNSNTLGKKSSKYKNSPQSELMSIFKYDFEFPLRKSNKEMVSNLIPKISFRASPQDMKNHSTTDRRINNDNIFSINRLSIGDGVESGESVTLGVDFTREKIDVKKEITEIEEYFDFKLATVLRFKEEKDIPVNSTINKKNSNIFGQVNFKPNEIISLKYDFSLTNDINRFEYNSIGAKLNYKNFSTEFNYLEESGIIGEANAVDNITEVNFNDYNSIIFKTRRNRNLNLTEYYDLVYEYKNDCLIADIKYRKDYYNSADIKPKEELFFSITIVPFYTYSPDKMILNKDRID